MRSSFNIDPRALCALLLILAVKIAAQTKTLDSLKLALKNISAETKTKGGLEYDTVRCSILNAMIEFEIDDAVWPRYNDELKSIAERNIKSSAAYKKVFQKYLATAYNNMGYFLQRKGQVQQAVE